MRCSALLAFGWLAVIVAGMLLYPLAGVPMWQVVPLGLVERGLAAHRGRRPRPARHHGLPRRPWRPAARLRANAAGGPAGNAATATAPKRVVTEIGQVEIEVPRDRDAAFDPQIVRKRQPRLE